MSAEKKPSFGVFLQEALQDRAIGPARLKEISAEETLEQDTIGHKLVFGPVEEEIPSDESDMSMLAFWNPDSKIMTFLIHLPPGTLPLDYGVLLELANEAVNDPNLGLPSKAHIEPEPDPYNSEHSIYLTWSLDAREFDTVFSGEDGVALGKILRPALEDLLISVGRIAEVEFEEEDEGEDGGESGQNGGDTRH